MKIMLVHPLPTRGGFTSVVSQAYELKAHGQYQVAVLVADGIRVAELPDHCDVRLLDEPLASVRGFRQLKQTLQDVRPDILHLHGRQAGLIGRLVPSRCRPKIILYTPHGTPWSGQSCVKAILTDLIERALLGRTSRVLCVSRSEQAEWVRRDQSDKVLYFPNLLNRPIMDTTAVKTPGLILVPGGYHPQKRLEVVIQAICMCRDSDTRVIFCGSVDDSEYKLGLERLAGAANLAERISFEGNLSNVMDLMARAEYVILPSYSEGMPIIGQEAILSGANVLWSAIPPHYELFGSSGGSFWTSSELADLIAMPGDVFSVSDRKEWLQRNQLAARESRRDYWQALNVHD